MYIDADRGQYMKQINSVAGMEHVINRENLYSEVLDLNRAGRIVEECPMFIKFKDEAAIDAGGVQKDMLSGFWEEAYKKLFEGSSILTPMIHPQIDLTVFPILIPWIFGRWFSSCKNCIANFVGYSAWPAC